MARKYGWLGMLVWILACILLPVKNTKAEEPVWKLKILEIKLHDQFDTVRTVKGEDGEEEKEEFHDTPSEGYCYAVCSVQMEKEILGGGTMDSTKIILHIGEESYSRMEDDSFLVHYNITPVKRDVLIGGFGQLCYEIPEEFLETKDFSAWYVSYGESQSETWQYGNLQVPMLMSTTDQTAAMEQDLLEQYRREGGDLEHALVRLNPYGNAPLTAAILFTTEKPCQAEVTIVSKDEGQEIHYINEEQTTFHQVGIFGLYADYENHVIIRAGEEVKEFTIQTEKAPAGITGILKEENCDSTESVLEQQLYLLHDGWYTVFDQTGEIRWYLAEKWHTDSVSGAFTFDKKKNGFWFSYGLVNGSPYRDGAQFAHMNWFGKIDRLFVFGNYCAHHSAELLPNGEILYYCGHDDARNEIMKLDPDTGEKSLLLNLNEVSWLDASVGNINPRTKESEDWLHPNSIQYVEEQNCLLLSFRNQHMLACLDYDTLEPKWILTPSYVEKDNGEIEAIQTRTDPYLILPDGEFDWFYTQHDLKFVEGTENTMDITVFDNGSARYYGSIEDEELDKRTDLRYSRMVRLHLDLDKKTVRTVFEYGKEEGVRLYSKTFGNTTYIPENDHYLGNFAGHNKILEKESYVAEVDAEGRLVTGFLLSGIKEGNYQAEPLWINQLDYTMELNEDYLEKHEYSVDSWEPYVLPAEDIVVKYETFNVGRLVRDDRTVTIYGKGYLGKEEKVKAVLLAVQNERQEVYSFPMVALQYCAGGYLGAGIPFTGLPKGNYILYVISYGEKGSIAAVKLNQRMQITEDHIENR